MSDTGSRSGNLYSYKVLTDRLEGKRHGVQPTFHNTRFFFAFSQ